MLRKSQIFSFITSLVITFIAGFFVWNIFVLPDNGIINKVLDEVSNINLQFFPASLFSSPNAINIIPETSLEQNDLTSESLADSTGIENQNPVVEESESVQDQLDDIQEKLDIISQQVQELVAQQNNNNTPDQVVADAEKDKTVDDQKDELADENNQDNQINQVTAAVTCTGQININTAFTEDLEKIIYVGPATAQKIIAVRPFYSLNDLLKVGGIGEITLQKIIEQGCAYVEPSSFVGGGGGGGGSAPEPIVYPKILISEIKIAEKTGDKDIFIELYNPSSQEVDLTNWYIFRNGTSFITKSMVAGKIIPANRYFLLTKEGSIWDSQSDLLFDGTLNDDDNIVLKNPNGDMTDEAAWTQIIEGLSWCADFGTCTPTPKAQNIKWVEPSLPALASIAITTPANKLVYNVGDSLDITGLTITGTYSDNSTQVEAIISADITGFNSSAPATGQILTVTVDGQTTSYTVDIITTLSNDATVISTAYTVSPLSNGTGTITNVSFGTDKTIFLNNLIFAIGAIENTTSSSLADPIVSNDTLAVTAQDGATTATYTVTVNPVVILPIITSYTFNGVAQNITVNPTTNPVQINIISNENVNWMYVRIVNISDTTIYKTFGSGSGCVDWTSSCSKTWDGGISHGTALIDGNYQIKVHIKDAANNEFEDYISPYAITVDSTLP